jgi:hypothetical protein
MVVSLDGYEKEERALRGASPIFSPELSLVEKRRQGSKITTMLQAATTSQQLITFSFLPFMPIISNHPPFMP